MYREETYTNKEAEKTMATTTDDTRMVAAPQTMALTPQIAHPEPIGDELSALWDISERLSKCGMFRTKRKQWNSQTKDNEWVEEGAPPEDVFMIVLSGRDFGLSAAASARHLKMIKGALSISAEIMRARLHQYGYEYDVKLSDEYITFPVTGYNNQTKQQKGPAFAEMTLWRRADPATKWVVRYETMEAVQAGLTKSEGGWDKNPGDMLVARVTSRTTRRYAPEVLNKTYLPEELGFYEGSDGQGGTHIVSLEVDGEAVPTAQVAPNGQSGATPPTKAKRGPKAAPKAATKPTAQEPPPHDAVTGEIIDGEYEVEGTPGSTQRLDTAPGVMDLEGDEEDEEPLEIVQEDVGPGYEGVPELEDEPEAEVAPAPPKPNAQAKPKAEAPPPVPEEDAAADELAYNPDGTPANEATRRWERENSPAAEEPEAESNVGTVGAEEAKFYANAGTLRAYLGTKGIKFHDNFKAQVGYGEKAWPDLDEDERVVIYMAARDGGV
jgi:hypothetical protein